MLLKRNMQIHSMNLVNHNKNQQNEADAAIYNTNPDKAVAIDFPTACSLYNLGIKDRKL